MKKRKKQSVPSLLIPLVGLALALIAFASFQLYRSRAALSTVDLTLNGPSTVGLNQTFTVDALANTNGLNVSAISLEISYDPNLMTLVDFTPSGLLSQTLKDLTINNGKANVVIGNSCASQGCTYFKGSGKLGTFNFKSLASSGNTALSFVPSATLADFHTQVAVIEASNINVAKIVGGISVRVGNATPSPTISPSPTPREGPTSISPTPVATPVTACIRSTSGWVNKSLSLYQDVFTVEFDATPNGSRIDSVTGLSYGSSNDFDDLAALVRFYTNGRIEARKGNTYTADTAITYEANRQYHFRMVIDPKSHRYSVYVKPINGKEVRLAHNYEFRQEQSNLGRFNNLAVRAPIGSHLLCNLNVIAGGDIGLGFNLTGSDINTSYAGTTTRLASGFLVKGSGTDIWTSNDSFHYASDSASGDVIITTKVFDWSPTESWSKAGIMIRSNKDANAPNAYVSVTGGKGIVFQWRPTAGSRAYSSYNALQTLSFNTPVWLRLVKSGTNFTAYYSADNVNWKQVGNSQRIDIPQTYQYGFAVTSHRNGSFSSAAFEPVSNP